MTTQSLCMLLTIVAYMALVVGIGLYFSKKNKTTDDFYLGGRNLGPFVTAMSAEASDMSSYLLMGIPGLAYLTGMSEAGWTIIGLSVGTYLNWLIVAKRLRVYTHKINAITIPEFFKNRYKDTSGALVGISALVILVFFIPYTASGFAACGKLFSSLFNVNYMSAMVVSAIVIAVYTMLGGFLAASTTDFLQSIIMSIALLIVLGYGTYAAGGVDVIMDKIQDIPAYISLTQGTNVASGDVWPYGGIVILSTLAWGLGYFGMPHVLLRFMAIKNENELKTSRRIASVWVVISMAVAMIIGFVGLAMSKEGVIPFLETSGDSERVIIKIAELIASHSTLLALVGGIILAGILASTMSTSDSQLLAASSSFSQNILVDMLGVKLSAKTQMLMARLTVIGISIIAIFLARNPDSSIFRIVSFAWAGFGAAFGPLMLFSLFWKKTSRIGAVFGMFTGGVAVFFWKFLVRPIGGIWDIYELLPAFILSSIVIVVVSLIAPCDDKEIIDTFDSVNADLKG